MGPTWGPPGSCRSQMGPMLAPWTLISGTPEYGAPPLPALENTINSMQYSFPIPNKNKPTTSDHIDIYGKLTRHQNGAMMISSVCTASKIFTWASCQIRKIVGCACAAFSPAAEFKGNRQLAFLACITACASRTCRDACRDRLPAVARKTFPAFPAHAHP